MRRMLLLITLAATTLSCTSTRYRKHVDPPVGKFCTHNAQLKIVFCSDLQGVKYYEPIPFGDTDKWIMFDPESFKNYIDYVDALKER